MLIFAGDVAIQAEPGETILGALKRAATGIHNVCGGRGMCGTCRVSVAPEWMSMLPKQAFSEIRLLRALKAGHEHHRLACQTILDDSLDGVRIVPDPPPIRTSTKETNP